MADDKTQYQVYESDSVSGGKLWAIGVASDGHVRVRYGAKDRPLRLRDIPVPAGHTADAEVRTRVADKLREGYVLIGEGRFDGRTVALEKKQADASVSWEISARIPRSTIHDELAWIAERLNEGPLPCDVQFDGESCTITATSATRKWALGYSSGIMDDRGGGSVDRNQLVPLLILLRLRRVFPDRFGLCLGEEELPNPQLAADDPLFGAHVFDQELVQSIGMRLDLCIGRVSLVEIASTGADKCIWF